MIESTSKLYVGRWGEWSKKKSTTKWSFGGVKVKRGVSFMIHHQLDGNLLVIVGALSV